VISGITSTRWALEALLGNSGIGDDVAEDPCWRDVDAQERDDLSQADKDALNCKCMGAAMFDECNFPGIRSPDFFDESLNDHLRVMKPARPEEPEIIPSPTPLPTPKPPPTPGLMGDQNAYRKKVEQQQKDYQARSQKQMQNWADAQATQTAAYREDMDDYEEDADQYGESKEKSDRAIQSAEGIIDKIYEDFGDAFVGSLLRRWVALGIISTVVLGLTVVFQKQKDVI
jgi:hypothetical protein